MNKEDREHIIYISFILVVLVMAVIYFTVPERSLFIYHQIRWWNEFWK
ncbi:MAG: hypothetical protein HZA16_15335 [Nitrospirae bacterium]|nr:hypothetical protein [Nitrospirota bacterium]